MIVDLTGLFDNGKTTHSLKGEINALDLKFSDYNIELLGPIVYDGMIYKVNDYYSLDLKINYGIKTECNRCLKTVEEDVKTQLFGKLVDHNVELQSEEEDLEEPIYLEKNTLDLRKYILEQVVSSSPLKIICSEDCKGLCQTCGVDLNNESCNCDDNIIDPRLEKLKELFPDQ